MLANPDRSLDPREERVLIWAPKGRDAPLVRELLQRSGLRGEPVAGIEALCREMAVGAGCAITSDDELGVAAQQQLSAAIARQPAWSDFPLIVLGPEFSTRAPRQLPVELGNVTALDRPVSARNLVAAVRQALRMRRRQYDARRAIRQRDQFLAMLGHELRNPLGAIALAVELLREGESGQRERQLHTLQRQSQHLTRLVDDLLDAARLTSGKLVLRRRPVELSTILRQCLQLAQSQAGGNRVHLKQGQVEPAWVNGDPVRLEQVLSNLLTNAIKYTEPDSEVIVSLAVEGKHCELRVRDQGLGIAPERLDKIFELFEQSDETLDRSRGGLGIGLTLVRSLVELHGGTVQARSAGLGAGSEFVVRLPRGTAPARRVPLGVRGHKKVPPGVRVVIVEDNPDLLEMLKEVLEGQGCRVHSASDGLSGVRSILEVSPDLALVDVGLPGLNGYEVAQQVRQAGASPLKLVAMTGYGQAEDRKRALAAGFDRHVTKPVDLDLLETLLAEAGSNLPH